MAKAELLSLRESKWQDSLAPLKQKYDAAMKAGEHATRLFLEFANDYWSAYEEATELAGTQQQRNARVVLLNERIGVDKRSESWISNLRSIGKEASWMRKHAAVLPRSADSLKLLAAAGQEKSIALIKSGDIDAVSSITDTRAALGKKPRHQVKSRSTYDGTLSFSSQADAVRVFADALDTTDATLSLGDKGTLGALQAHVGKQRWAKVSSRVRV
jgi:hypothetical protein